MIDFLEYLYYKYYCFQKRVGNSDIAAYSSPLFILFIIMVYYFALFFIIITIVPKTILIIDETYFKVFSVVLLLGVGVRLYMLLLYKKKYREIIKRQRQRKSSNILAILFPLAALVLFNMGWILKMFQNQEMV